MQLSLGVMKWFMDERRLYGRQKVGRGGEGVRKVEVVVKCNPQVHIIIHI